MKRDIDEDEEANDEETERQATSACAAPLP